MTSISGKDLSRPIQSISCRNHVKLPSNTQNKWRRTAEKKRNTERKYYFS